MTQQQLKQENRDIAELLKRAAEDAQIRAMYHPTQELRDAEKKRAKLMEEHANSLFGRL